MTPTANLGYQSFYQAQLTAGISNTDLTIPLDVVPTPSEGFLVLESTVPSKREIIYYTSKTSNSVVCPAGGRGYDGTTASSHLQNASVIMAPVAAMFSSMRDLFETTPQGWTPVTQTVSSVAYNGNRSYTLTMSADVSATLSPGMRVRTTRTVSAPTQCTDLESGSSQYFSRASASVNGMSFTDDFTCMAWVKLESYTGGIQNIISRRTTTGWAFRITSGGQVDIVGIGSGTFRSWQSFQSIPLNKWVHVAATLDMSGYTSATCKIFIDGVEVPGTPTNSGSPTSLIAAGDLQVGAGNATEFFDGKIAQAAVFSAVLSQATIRSYISQGLAGTETNLISAYSFNNSINDLNTTNANNLTAQGSAVATNADSPFSVNSFGTATGTTDYGIIQSVATTTAVVQVPEGNTIPTSGGVSAMSYSTQKAPYGMPVHTDKWLIEAIHRASASQSSPVASTWYNMGSVRLSSVPVGEWTLTYQAAMRADKGTATILDLYTTLSTTTSTETDKNMTYFNQLQAASATIEISIMANRTRNYSVSSATNYNLLTMSTRTPAFLYDGSSASPAIITAQLANL